MEQPNEWLEISDLNKFTNYLRKMVYINFSEDKDEEFDLLINNQAMQGIDNDELNQCLTVKESKIIIRELAKKFRNKHTGKIKYLVNDEILYSIIENLNQRMVSNLIASLVSKGLLESAFDTEKNDFVFWAKKE